MRPKVAKFQTADETFAFDRLLHWDLLHNPNEAVEFPVVHPLLVPGKLNSLTKRSGSVVCAMEALGPVSSLGDPNPYKRFLTYISTRSRNKKPWVSFIELYRAKSLLVSSSASSLQASWRMSSILYIQNLITNSL